MTVEKPNFISPTGEIAKPIDESLKWDLEAMDQARDKAIAEMEKELQMCRDVPEKYKQLVSGIEEGRSSWGDTLISSSSGTGMRNLFIDDSAFGTVSFKDHPIATQTVGTLTPFARVFVEAARGKNVCDLGGGQYPGAEMMLPTESAYAKRYIDIDLNTHRKLFT